MKILLCNAANSQGGAHSRKGMYAPLGMLSVATYVQQELGDQVEFTIMDEDVDVMDRSAFGRYDLVGFYATTFNYNTTIAYAEDAKAQGCVTAVGGPHPTTLAPLILQNRDCFDYVIVNEGEYPFLGMVRSLLDPDAHPLEETPNLVFKRNGVVTRTPAIAGIDIVDLPIPSREFIDYERYIQNFRTIYPEKGDARPGSFYSCKGCSWRDKTGGCVFCARLEKGTRYRDIDQIWEEVEHLRATYDVNTLWDISDDNLADKQWFKTFVARRPASCKHLTFFVYSRVNNITDDLIPPMLDLNVEEVFLGVESGDNGLLRTSHKGQTREGAMRAIRKLRDAGLHYFPSFVLGLPRESRESLQNTLSMCEELCELGGLTRLASTILIPVPGSPAYQMLIENSEIGPRLATQDDVDLNELERVWCDTFTDCGYDVIKEYKHKIDAVTKDLHTFGSVLEDS